MRNDRSVKTLGLAPFSFQSETLINKISRQKATTDILMAHGFSADVFEQFFRWTLVASVDPSVKTQRNALGRIKWRTKMFIPFRLTHAQTKCLCSVRIEKRVAQEVKCVYTPSVFSITCIKYGSNKPNLLEKGIFNLPSSLQEQILICDAKGDQSRENLLKINCSEFKSRSLTLNYTTK